MTITSNTYRLRRARPRDIDALVLLEQHFPTDRLRRSHVRHLIMRGNVDMFVIEYGGVPIANAVVRYRANSETARLYSIVVAPAHRGKKLGDILLDAAEAAAIRRGCKKMSLEVGVYNYAAQRLYRRRGYIGARRIEKYYEDGTGALRLQAPLKASLIAAA